MSAATQPPQSVPKKESRFMLGAAAIMMACAFNHFGDRLLGVRIEILDVFVIPFLAGMLVSVIYGFGGKWLCYFPPMIVRAISYFEIAQISGVPHGAALMPLGWWGFFVILVVEAAVIGGVLGEVVIKRTYGRRDRHLVYKDSPKPAEKKP